MGWDPRTPYNELPDLRAAESYESEATLKASRNARDALRDFKASAKPDEIAADALEQAAMLREAWASCWIEGIEMQLSELVENQYQGGAEYRIRQGAGAARTWEKAIAAPRPNTGRAEAWCSSLKCTLMQVRNTRVFIGSRYECRYMPPEGNERLSKMLQALWKFTDGPYRDPIARMAMAHYQFEAIHPFTDGNGRTGRMLNVALLARAGVTGHRLIAPSVGILKRLPEYYRLLTEMTRSDCWEEWIIYMAGTVAEAAQETQKTWTARATRAEEQIRGWVAETPRKSDQAVLRQACLRMCTTPGEIAKVQGAPDQSATRRMLERMVGWGLLHHNDGRGRRPYVNSQAVAEWLTDPEPWR